MVSTRAASEIGVASCIANCCDQEQGLCRIQILMLVSLFSLLAVVPHGANVDEGSLLSSLLKYRRNLSPQLHYPLPCVFLIFIRFHDDTRVLLEPRKQHFNVFVAFQASR